MKSFSIHELQNLSGIKAHTIRIWEHRYGILKPQRSKGNCRFYSLEELKHLLDIAVLVKDGKRISNVSQLSCDELKMGLKKVSKDETAQEKVIAALVYFMFSTEVDEFESLLDSCISSWGIDTTIKNIIIPFLQRVNVLSYASNRCEVHYIVTILRKKIILGIETENVEKISDKCALLFLPENEHYDLILLFISYILKLEGIKILYLGTNINVEILKVAIEEKSPDFLVTYIHPKSAQKLKKLQLELHDQFSKRRLNVIHCIDTAQFSKTTNLNFIPLADVQTTAKNIQASCS